MRLIRGIQRLLMQGSIWVAENTVVVCRPQKCIMNDVKIQVKLKKHVWYIVEVANMCNNIYVWDNSNSKKVKI